MNVITIEEQAFKTLLDKIEALENKFADIVHKANYPTKERWLDMQDVLEILKCSRRQLQIYRDTKQIPFSQINQKIYYKASDIEKFLLHHYNKVKGY